MSNFGIGAFISVAILLFTFLHSNISVGTFLNYEGIALVFGGTISILLISSNRDTISLLKSLFRRIVRKKRSSELKAILLECSQRIAAGNVPKETGHPFLDRSLGWLAVGLKGETLDKLLLDGAKIELDRYEQAVSAIGNLAKYPPALGMIGTVFGIISIFNGLNSELGQRDLGVNLAFAMTATMYGLVMSNFVISPVADFLLQAMQEEQSDLSMVVETVRMWSQKEGTFFIKENLELYHAA
jgi:chemotaxis protein MotA